MSYQIVLRESAQEHIVAQKRSGNVPRQRIRSLCRAPFSTLIHRNLTIAALQRFGSFKF
jgi:hypothetical protein